MGEYRITAALKTGIVKVWHGEILLGTFPDYKAAKRYIKELKGNEFCKSEKVS